MENSEQLLHDITSSYELAEITCIVVEKKGTKEFVNLLTLIELVPSEQVNSSRLGEGKYPFHIRESIDDYTFYFSRLLAQPVAEGLSVYLNAEEGIDLNYLGGIHIQVREGLVQNPPDYRPLLIDSKNEKTIGRVLPYRLTMCRFWSKLNLDKQWLSAYPEKFFTKLSILSQKHLGYDLTKIQEHIGNIYLFGCNPLLRFWETELLDFNRDLLIRFKERAGRSIIGSRLVLQEHRADNPGFYLTYNITSVNQHITLPYFPDVLDIKIIDRQGQLIDSSFGGWANFNISMNVQHTAVEYHLNIASGEKVFTVPKKSSERSIKIGEYDWTAAHYLRNALRSRRFQDLAASKEFVFFPKHPDSPERAKQVVRELLNQAREKCMILDPYFGPGDLIYAFHVENISLPVQIISSAQYLNSRPTIPEPKKGKRATLWDSIRALFRKEPLKEATYLERLVNAVEEYRKHFPQQKIECKVLVGKKSPLHDRFIVIDHDVYLLGSSLNEFGDRTTTITKVPDPKELIDQAVTWWEDDKKCPRIEDFIHKNDTDNDL
jgi:hypothetical protein